MKRRPDALRREARVLSFCLLVALLLNVAAIIGYGTRWIELVTQFGWMALIATALYVIVCLARLLLVLVRRRSS